MQPRTLLLTGIALVGLILATTLIRMPGEDDVVPLPNRQAAALVGSTEIATASPAAPEASQPTPAPAGGEASGEGDEGAIIVSLDGEQVFTVPKPDDPDWDDYLEMLEHPQYRTIRRNPGEYPIPYDPEWRSVVTGRRDVDPIDLELEGGKGSIEELGEALVAAVTARDSRALFELAVSEKEFKTIFWPEFPQSRPYLRIPADEVWGFHHAKCHGGIKDVLGEFGGRRLELERLITGNRKPYTGFTMIEDVKLQVLDLDNHERYVLSFVPTLVKRNGTYKAYIYRD
jgi:hypothetical protein